MSEAGDRPVLLQARGLKVRRDDREVVRGIDLAVQAGEWLAVVGPNGAGKSSMLRALAGLTRPSAGCVQRPAVRELAWLGQDAAGDEAMTVADVAALGRLPHQGWMGWPRTSDPDRLAVEQALRDTDMGWALSTPLGRLSGGERQRAHLARALATQASVLLLDEPVAHLDAPHQRLVGAVLRREADRARAVVSVLHELPLALQADRIAVMGQGLVRALGSRDDPVVHRAIEAVFDHAVMIVRLQGRWIVVPSP